MNILAVSHLFPNAIQPTTGLFVKERIKFVAQQVNVQVVAPIPFFPVVHRLRSLHQIKHEENYAGLHIFHPRYFGIPRCFKFLDGYFYYYSLNEFIGKYLNSNPVDLFDFHWVYPDAFSGLKWAKRYSKKIVVTIRGNESISYFENSPRKKMTIQTLQAVDHVIAVSTELKNKVVQKYGVNEKNVTVIPNGIDADKFQHISRQRARRLCQLNPDSKYVLTVCRLSPEKGLQYLLQAIARLNQQNVKLIIVGDGPLKKKLQKLTDQLGITQQIFFVGAVSHSEIWKWYNASDVFCLPSLWEGCPNVIIESLACGTPVVATNVGGIPDLIPSPEYGRITVPGDEVSLSRLLNESLEYEWNRLKIAEFGIRNTWEHVANQVIDVFNRVVYRNDKE